jgi:hypothetical protein
MKAMFQPPEAMLAAPVDDLHTLATSLSPVLAAFTETEQRNVADSRIP